MLKRNKAYPINPKISETLVEFARPILEEFNIPSEKEALAVGFMVAVSVWNSLILDRQDSSDRYRTELLIRAATGPDGLDDLVDKLILRKNKFYFNDMRLISNEKVFWKNGELHVSAEARGGLKEGGRALSDKDGIRE